MPRHLPLAALLTAAAGATHLAAAVPHFSTNPLYGTLFVGAGWTQLILAALLLASARAGLARAAVVVNAMAIAAWGLSRTVGLPLAHTEPVLLADALTVALEVAASGVLVARLRGAAFGWRDGQPSVLPLIAVLALATGASTVAIAGLGSGGHEHGADSGDAGGGHAASEPAPEGAASEAGPEGAASASGNERPAEDTHEHPDGTVHIHQAGKPHVHPDRTVHVHPEDESPDEEAADGHGHAEGGHAHEHEGSH